MTTRRFLLIALAMTGITWGWDLATPPPGQVTGKALVGGIRVYQRLLSPRMSSLGVRCRFEPTCSHYGAAVISEYGALKGVAKTAWRIARCGPWTEAGTHDPP